MAKHTSAVERLIALAGVSKVDAHTRVSKKGKVYKVETYTRAVSSMDNTSLYQQYKDLSAGKGADGWSPAQTKNRLQQVTGEIRQRQTKGEWGHSNKSSATKAQNKVDKTKGAEGRGREVAREKFEGNKAAPKPKVERLKKYETGEVDREGKPVTDAVRDKDGKTVETEEYKAEVARVTSTIDAIFKDPKKIREYETQQKHGIFEEVVGEDGKKRQKFVAYTPERTEQHKKIISDFLEASKDVPTDRHAIMSGGLGGAGKGFILKKHAGVDQTKYLTVDPDEMKQEILRRGMGPDVPDLLPMEQAAFIHEESSDLANMLHEIAMERGMNIILDTTMAAKGASGTESSVDGKIEKFRAAGYEIHGVFVDVTVDTSIGSALDRHLGGVNRFNSGDESDEGELGGRYVPPAYIEKSRTAEGSEFNSRNREVFERLISEGKLDGSEIWDNDDRSEGASPKLVSKALNTKSTTGTTPKKAEKKAEDTSANALDRLKKKQAPEKVALSALSRLSNKLTSVK